MPFFFLYTPGAWESARLNAEVHQGQCPHGQQAAAHPDQALHDQMHVLLSRLDEPQRRWSAAVESTRLGHGGDPLVARMTGLDPHTIPRGRQELAAALAERPTDRVRTPGAGRPRAEKQRSTAGNGPAGDRDARNGGGSDDHAAVGTQSLAAAAAAPGAPGTHGECPDR